MCSAALLTPKGNAEWADVRELAECEANYASEQPTTRGRDGNKRTTRGGGGNNQTTYPGMEPIVKHETRETRQATSDPYDRTAR
jgi:hypothetical protein